MSQNIVLPVRKDIFMIIDELRKIVESSNMIKEQNVPERVCEFIETFLKRRFVPVEYAEKLLSIVANIVEKAETEGSLDMFAQDQHFLLLLIQIIDAFSKNNTTASVLMNSFRSHYCYELVLFILLGFVEKTKTLSIFVNTVLNVDDLMKSLLQALNKLVMHDELYLTQEMGLEILVRIGYFLVNKAESVYISLKPSIKGPVLDILQNGKTAVFNCLQDMRKVLGVINTQNENIVTQSISNFTIRGEEAIYRGSSNGWLDICKEYFCIHLPEDDVFLRIKYHSVKAFESKSHRVLEFSVLDSVIPGKLKEMFNVDATKSKFAKMELTFQRDSDFENVTAIFHNKFEEYDVFPDPNEKFSAASTRLKNSEIKPKVISSEESVSEISEDKEEEDSKFHSQQCIKNTKRLNINKIDSLVQITNAFSYNVNVSGAISSSKRYTSRNSSKSKTKMLKRITAANADADNFEANVDYIEPSLIDQSPQDIIEAADYYIEPTSIDQSTHDKLIVDSISNDWIEQDQNGTLTTGTMKNMDESDQSVESPCVDDQNSVISKIIEEITNIQNFRSRKKRTKVLSSTERSISLQLQLYRDYWLHHIDGGRQETSINWKLKLDKCTSIAHTLQNFRDKVETEKRSIDEYFGKFEQCNSRMKTFSMDLDQLLKQNVNEANSINQRIENHAIVGSSDLLTLSQFQIIH